MMVEERVLNANKRSTLDRLTVVIMHKGQFELADSGTARGKRD
jgi:hypothetical protein